MYIDILIFSSTDGSYHVDVPSVYVAFSGDLIINYTIPSNVSIPNAFIRVLAVTANQNQEITTRGLHFGQSAGNLRIACGIIEMAVLHFVELHTYAGGPILASAKLKVEWPKIILTLPRTHIAQTHQVPLRFVSRATCNSLLKRFSFQVDLEYYSDFYQTRNSSHSQANIVYSQAITDITQSVQDITYACDLFDSSGYYKAVLRNSFESSNIVAESNIMNTTWSTAYEISVFDKSVFPCTGHVNILYIVPECAGKNNKIRVYKLLRDGSGSLAAPLKREYVAEMKADPDQNYVLFSCDIFAEQAAGFCFVYVTTSKRGSVSEQDSKCLSAHPDSGAYIQILCNVCYVRYNIL